MESCNSLNKKPLGLSPRGLNWVQSLDLNQGPSGYEPDELPGCSTLHQERCISAHPTHVCQRVFLGVCWPRVDEYLFA
jgi:hypothetical protein